MQEMVRQSMLVRLAATIDAIDPPAPVGRPRAAIVDTRRGRTGPQRGPRGYDAHKKTKGRKRVLLVDTQGDPLGVRVVLSEVQDRDSLHALAPDLDRHASPLLVWLDRAFTGHDPDAFLRRHGLTPKIVCTLAAGRRRLSPGWRRR
jgi:hypothetical protein